MSLISFHEVKPADLSLQITVKKNRKDKNTMIIRVQIFILSYRQQEIIVNKSDS